MKLVKLAIISAIVLFLLITGMSLFIPSHVRISKAINLKASRSLVMGHIRDAGEWKKWYPGLDSAKPIYREGTTGIKGWVLENADSSRSATISIVKEDSTEVTANFVSKRTDPVVNVWKTLNLQHTDSLTLQWYMDFHLRWYPWEKFASLLLEKSYGAKMEQGLSNLKKEVENK